MTMHTKPLLALASACLLLTACASGGSTSGVSPLVGSYQNGQSVATFNADGSFSGATPDGEEWVRGTYTLDGKTMTMVDTWEDEAVLTERCEGIPGRYAWSLEGDTLVARVIEDACEGRSETIDNQAWKRLP